MLQAADPEGTKGMRSFMHKGGMHLGQNSPIGSSQMGWSPGKDRKTPTPMMVRSETSNYREVQSPNGKSIGRAASPSAGS